MTFGQSVNTVLREKYATFEGRAQRSELWWFALFSFLLQIAIAVVSGIFGAIDPSLGAIIGLLSIVVSLALIIPSIAVGVRRLHDIDRTGWWILISFVPLVGFIVLLVFYCTKGTDGPNQFGPDPLGASGAGMAHPA